MNERSQSDPLEAADDDPFCADRELVTRSGPAEHFAKLAHTHSPGPRRPDNGQRPATPSEPARLLSQSYTSMRARSYPAPSAPPGTVSHSGKPIAFTRDASQSPTTTRTGVLHAGLPITTPSSGVAYCRHYRARAGHKWVF